MIEFHDEEIEKDAIPGPEEIHIDNLTADLLKWHYKLEHLPFKHIRAMALRGELPKRLATCNVLKCPG